MTPRTESSLGPSPLLPEWLLRRRTLIARLRHQRADLRRMHGAIAAKNAEIDRAKKHYAWALKLARHARATAWAEASRRFDAERRVR